jgi:hypothetical protein
MISSQDPLRILRKRNDELYALIPRLINLKWYSRSVVKRIYNFNLISSLTKVLGINVISQDADSVLCIGTDIETGKQVL